MNTPTVAFYLDKKAIYVNVRGQLNKEKKSLKYFPGITVENESDWQGGKVQRSTDTKIQVKLDSIKVAVNEVVAENDIFQLDNPTFEKLINSKLEQKKLGNKKSKIIGKENLFIPYAESFVAYKKENRDKIGCKDYKSINTTVRMLKKFKPNLVFERIDKTFNDDYIEYMQKKGQSDNYIAKMFGNLKQILDKATDDGINKKLDYLRFEKKKRRKAFSVYLSEKQLETILNMKFDLTGNPEADFLRYSGRETGVPGWTAEQYRQSTELMIESYENVRKHLIIGCWTGMRGGNFLKINPKTQIFKNEETGMFEITAVANKETGLVTIPMHWMIEQIYVSGSWPYGISEKTFNEQVKEVVRLAGFTKPMIFEQFKGGKQVIATKRFNELVSSHTGRRSFCSNLLIQGMSKQYIMNFSGHKTEDNFNKYTAHVSKDIMKAKASEHNVWRKENTQKKEQIII